MFTFYLIRIIQLQFVMLSLNEYAVLCYVMTQLRVALMDLMREAEVIDAETNRPITGSLGAETGQSAAVQQLLRSTDDLAALDKLDEVIYLLTCLLGRVAASHHYALLPNAAYFYRCSVVGVCVCLSVDHNHEPYKIG